MPSVRVADVLDRDMLRLLSGLWEIIHQTRFDANICDLTVADHVTIQGVRYMIVTASWIGDPFWTETGTLLIRIPTSKDHHNRMMLNRSHQAVQEEQGEQSHPRMVGKPRKLHQMSRPTKQSANRPMSNKKQ